MVMMAPEELGRLLEVVEADHVDLRYTSIRSLEVALREESFEVNEESERRVACHVLQGGYGVASTTHLDRESIRQALEEAKTQAQASKARLTLAPVKVEEGREENKARMKPDRERAKELLLNIRNLMKAHLGPLYARSELILSYNEVESSIATNEGARVSEAASYIDLTLYLVVREMGMGFASKVLGGRGGLEAIESRDLEEVIRRLAKRARAMARARALSPLERGKRMKVILDSEAAGALAHEIAHLLEGDTFRWDFFKDLHLSEDLKLIDDPTIPGAYGSFTWDDEAVRGRRKVLLQRGVLDLLHTRLTAGEEGTPGNAKGMTHIPKPSMSNIYFGASDWGASEMLQETKRGIYIEGLVRAETDTSEGIIEIRPEAAYWVEDKEIKQPLKRFRLLDTVKGYLQSIDAIGKVASLRPNVEKGYMVSEGGPFIRLNGVYCA